MCFESPLIVYTRLLKGMFWIFLSNRPSPLYTSSSKTFRFAVVPSSSLLLFQYPPLIYSSVCLFRQEQNSSGPFPVSVPPGGGEEHVLHVLQHGGGVFPPQRYRWLPLHHLRISGDVRSTSVSSKAALQSLFETQKRRTESWQTVVTSHNTTGGRKKKKKTNWANFFFFPQLCYFKPHMCLPHWVCLEF